MRCDARSDMSRPLVIQNFARYTGSKMYRHRHVKSVSYKAAIKHQRRDGTGFINLHATVLPPAPWLCAGMALAQSRRSGTCWTCRGTGWIGAPWSFRGSRESRWTSSSSFRCYPACPTTAEGRTAPAPGPRSPTMSWAGYPHRPRGHSPSTAGAATAAR